jgi:hypothetical protein
MNIPLAFKTQTSMDIGETVPVTSLIERAIDYLQQERYTEGRVLLTLAGEYFPPDQVHLAPLLKELRQESERYSHLQHTLQEMSARFIEVQAELQASIATLSSLRSTLLEVALRKLQVTVSILRRSLQPEHELRGGYILCKQGVYQLNPSVAWHSDVEEFVALYNAGRKASGKAAASYYERACSLYTRPFLIEDLYADWSFPRREQLRQIHREMCSALATHYLETQSYEQASRWGTAIIEENQCDEVAYQQLMRIYALAGRRNAALHLYQRCQQVLLQELGVQPMPETVALHQAIINGELHH